MASESGVVHAGHAEWYLRFGSSFCLAFLFGRVLAKCRRRPRRPVDTGPANVTLTCTCLNGSSYSADFLEGTPVWDIKAWLGSKIEKPPQCLKLIAAEAGALPDDQLVNCNMDSQLQVLFCRAAAGVGVDTSTRLSLPDGCVAASSQYRGGNPEQYQPRTARLNMNDRGWAPESNDMQSGGSWLQIDLQRECNIVGIASQGSGAHPEWTTQFKVYISNTGNEWENARCMTETGESELFDANTDQHTVVYTDFDRPVRGRFLRFNPTQWRSHATLRVEIFVN